MDVSSSYLSKTLLPKSDILLFLGHKRSPKFVRYLEILIFTAVQSKVLIFPLAGSFNEVLIEDKSANPTTLFEMFHSNWSGNRSVTRRRFLSGLRTVGK